MTDPFKISSLFFFKDKLPKHMRASVVYKFSCVQCTSEYVGSTTHSLYRRVAQHSGRSFRTNRLLTTPPHSNIRDHTFNCHSPITLENFTILNSCKSETDLHILESLYIYKTNPVLNSSQSAHPLNIVNKWYLCLFYNYILLFPPPPPSFVISLKYFHPAYQLLPYPINVKVCSLVFLIRFLFFSVFDIIFFNCE